MTRPTRGHAAEAAGALLLALAALKIAVDRGVGNLDAVADVLRGVTAFSVLLVVAGYAPARLLVARPLWASFPVLVPLVGCASAGLGLTALGFLGVPFAVSLGVLLATGSVAGAAVRWRRGPARPGPQEMAAAGGRRFTLLWPGYLAALVVALLLTPAFANGFVSVQGNNPDGLLGVGSAELLQHAYPTAIAPGLPVDRMPGVWRSKYPIYYALAGAASLSGLDTTQVFGAVCAVLAALAAAGFMLVARHTLRAPPAAGVLVMALVGLSGAVTYLALHPYHNQLWGAVALGPTLLFALRFMQGPNRRDGALLAAFLFLGLAAYPLMVIFPAAALAGAAAAAMHEDRSGLGRPRLPRTARGRAGLAALALVATPAALVVGLGVVEKSVSAARLLNPGSDLSSWRGDTQAFLPAGFFLGVPGVVGSALAVVLLGAAVLGTARMAPVPRAAFGAMIAGGVGFAAYFHERTFGEYFYFKLLAFEAPILVVAAAWVAAGGGGATRGRVPGFARGAPALVAAAVGVVVIALQLQGLRRELIVTNFQLDTPTLQLRAAAQRLLPKGASVRVDVLPDGRQLWVSYVLSAHPLSTLNPLTFTTYPYIPVGRRADYIVADSRVPFFPWPDAEGSALFDNGAFRIYRMKRGVPGRDRSSQRMIE
jgi:hypothetical protein